MAWEWPDPAATEPTALVDLAIGDRIVREADGGRRPKSIREILGEGAKSESISRSNP